MAGDDSNPNDAAAEVMARHGPGARAFAAERLAFCKATRFGEGVILWSAILDRIVALTPEAPHRPR